MLDFIPPNARKTETCRHAANEAFVALLLFAITTMLPIEDSQSGTQQKLRHILRSLEMIYVI